MSDGAVERSNNHYNIRRGDFLDWLNEMDDEEAYSRFNEIIWEAYWGCGVGLDDIAGLAGAKNNIVVWFWATGVFKPDDRDWCNDIVDLLYDVVRELLDEDA